MTGREILKEIAERRTADHQFIRWWRKEEDWLDYDLIDRFVENANPNEAIDGYELVTMDEMWDNLLRSVPGRVQKAMKQGSDVLVWRKKSGEEQVCPFNAESVMAVFDVETRGQVVD